MRRPGQASILSIALVVAVSVLVLATVTSFSGFYSFNVQPLSGEPQTYKSAELLMPRNLQEQFQVQDTNISVCTTIDSSGTYVFIQDIIDSDTEPCIGVWADDVIIDCQGHTLDGTWQDSGIWVQGGRSNITVRNCTIREFNYGVVLNANWEVNITNNKFKMVGAGVWGNQVDLSNITNNLFAMSSVGIYMAMSDNNTISDNNCHRNNQGIHVDGAYNNVIYNNVTYNSDTGIFLDNAGYNSISNNLVCNNMNRDIWMQSSGYNFGDNTCDTLGDESGGGASMSIMANTVTCNTACPEIPKPLFLCEWAFGQQDLRAGNYRLGDDINSTSTDHCFMIWESGVSMDCQGHKLYGPSELSGASAFQLEGWAALQCRPRA